METLKLSYVLCTLNRPDQIRRLIFDILELDDSFNTEIIVVDASPSRNITEESEIFDSYAKIRLIRSSPGLPHQRNVGLSYVSGDIVLFLDDDVLIRYPLYPSLAELFANPQIVGAAPLIGIPENNLSSREMVGRSIIEKVRIKKAGRLSKSGIHTWPRFLSDSELIDVDWLPGCAMAYRSASLVGLQFSTALQKGPTGGYALGEDLDFALQVSTRGSLVCFTCSSIEHYLAEGIRDKAKVMAEARGRLLAYLVRKYPDKVRTNYVSIRLIVGAIYRLGLGLTAPKHRDSHWEGMKINLRQLFYFFRELWNPILLP